MREVYMKKIKEEDGFSMNEYTELRNKPK